MSQDKHTLPEFLADDHFISWVLHPDKENDLFWSCWAKQNPAKAAELEEARNLILLVSLQQAKPAADQAGEVWERIEAVIQETGPEEKAAVRSLYPLPGLTWFAWIARSRQMAASLTLAVLLAGLGYLISRQYSKLDSRISLEKRFNTYGQRSVLLLPDGSKVYLNAGSTLQYAHDFEDQPQRLVYLSGEAFFEVVKNKQKPFIVKTGELAVRVLGTRFNVKAYADETLVETTLVTGKVQLNRKTRDDRGPEWQQPIRLLPNQKADFSKRDGKIALAMVDPLLYTSWIKGKLLFEDTPLQEVVKVLNRAYNVRIQLADHKLNRCTLTADLSNLPLTQTLEIMCRLVEARFSKNGKVILIKGKGC